MGTWFEGLSLPVADLDRSVAFYESLGFSVEIRTDRFGLLRHGTGTLGLLQLGDAPAGRLRSFVQIEMGTDDLDGLHADFVARDIPVHIPPRDRGFERQMQLRDPDGFTVEFAEARAGTTAPGSGSLRTHLRSSLVVGQSLDDVPGRFECLRQEPPHVAAAGAVENPTAVAAGRDEAGEAQLR